jgi:hypothetical protein
LKRAIFFFKILSAGRLFSNAVSAARGADVQDARRPSAQDLQGLLDQELGLGPGDKHGRAHQECFPVKLLLFQDIGQRLIIKQPLQMPPEFPQAARIADGLVFVYPELGAANPEGPLDYDLHRRGQFVFF